MSKFFGLMPTPSSPTRTLQLRQKGKLFEVVDKETQQPIGGVIGWQVDVYANGGEKTTCKAKIELVMDIADVFYTPEVEGSVVDAPLALPIQALVISEESMHFFAEEETPEQKRLREGLAEITHITEDAGEYD